MIANLLRNVRIRNVMIATFFVFGVNVAIDVIWFEDSLFVGGLNSFVVVSVVSLATVLCWYYWSVLNKQADSIEKIWRMLGIGFVLWTAAELIWFVLSSLGSEVPYPSVADVLWVVGYIFFFLPFFRLYRLLRIAPEAKTTIFILGFALVYVVVVSIYVVAPIVQDTSSSLLEKALGALYPIEDLIITLGAAFLALALVGGAFSWVWSLLALGFLCLSFSDILFVYADWNGMYLPDGSLNFLSVMVDMSYVLGYMLAALGIYIQIEFTINGIEEPLVSRYKSMLDEPTRAFQTVKIILYTNAENNVISASPGIAHLLAPEKMPELDGMPFNQAVGMDYEFARRLLHEMRHNGSIPNQSVSLLAVDGQSVSAKIEGVANFNVSNLYIGSDITIAIPVSENKLISGIDVVDSIKDGDNLENEEKRQVSTFFSGKIHALYVITSRFGGAHAAQSLQRVFNTHTRSFNLDMQMDGPNVIFDSKDRGVTIYRELMKTVVNYSIAIVSFEALHRELEKWESKQDPTLIQAAKKAGILGVNLDSEQSADASSVESRG